MEIQVLLSRADACFLPKLSHNVGEIKGVIKDKKEKIQPNFYFALILGDIVFEKKK